MQFSLSVIALAASLVSVSAGNLHSRLHQRVHARDVGKRGLALVSANANIQTLPALGNNPNVKEGPGYEFENTLINNSTDSAQVYFWNAADFSLAYNVYNQNPPQPALIVSLPANSQQVVSFSNGFSGSYAAVWPDTVLGNAGNFMTSWVELTTANTWGAIPAIDLSMEPAMNARATVIQTDGCQSDAKSCSFVCKDPNAPFCGDAGTYTLQPASSPEWTNCMMGTANGQPSGGCKLSPTFTTTFN